MRTSSRTRSGWRRAASVTRRIAARRLAEELEPVGRVDDLPGDLPEHELIVHDQNADGAGALDGIGHG